MLTAGEIKDLASLKQKKFRKEQNKFLIEGFHLIEECINSSFNLECVIIRKGVSSGNLRLGKIRVEEVSAKAFAKLSETENSQGIIGVVSIPKNTKNEEGNITIALDGINDPGNLGTILRTAYWFGVKNILLSKGSANVFNPKVIRASQGAVFHTNVKENVTLEHELRNMQKSGSRIYLFTPDGSKPLNELDRSANKVVLVFGSESHGISGEILESNYDEVRIGGFSDCESLNVAISLGIALYEVTSKYS